MSRRGRRTAHPLVVVVAIVVVFASAAPTDAATCWQPPVVGLVVDPFRAPACRWCPGNRGLEYRVGEGTVVRSVAAGEVTFSGAVAGVGYVVVAHADGHRTTYGGLSRRVVRRGDVVAARSRLGVVSGTFHFGVRDGESYVDPGPLLGELVGRPRLVPLDGTPPRPAGPARLRCATRAVGR